MILTKRGIDNIGELIEQFDLLKHWDDFKIICKNNDHPNAEVLLDPNNYTTNIICHNCRTFYQRPITSDEYRRYYSTERA